MVVFKKAHLLGAYKYVYIFKNKKQIDLKAYCQPVGLQIIEKDFKLKTLDLLTDAAIYMYPNGYISI